MDSDPDLTNNLTKALDSIKDVLSKTVKDQELLTGVLSKVEFVSSTITALLSTNLTKAVRDICDEADRKKIVVLDGVPESNANSPSLKNQEDLTLARKISDNLGLESTIWATERLGRIRVRPRLLKLFFLSSKAAALFLRGFHALRASDPSFSGVFARFSQSEAERLKEFELRKKARELTEKEGIPYVVYAGRVAKKEDIPKIREELRKHSSQSSSSGETASIKALFTKPQQNTPLGASRPSAHNSRQQLKSQPYSRARSSSFTLPHAKRNAVSSNLREMLTSTKLENWARASEDSTMESQ